MTLNQHQREKVDEKRLKAKMVVCEKTTLGLVTNVGPSWFTALEQEFTKPYFDKVIIARLRPCFISI